MLIDMRTPEGSWQALDGLYPSSVRHMQTGWVNCHKETVQKPADAFGETLRWMSTHSAAEIAATLLAARVRLHAELGAVVQHPVEDGVGLQRLEGQHVPSDYARGGGKDLCLKAVESTQAMFAEDGVMPEGFPRRWSRSSQRSTPSCGTPR